MSNFYNSCSFCTFVQHCTLLLVSTEFLCTHLVYPQSMVENWYSLLHSRTGHSSFYREGLWLPGCVRKQGESKGSVRWRRRERKWKHIHKKNTGDILGFVPVPKENQPMVGWLWMKKGLKWKRWIYESRIAKTENYRYEYVLPHQGAAICVSPKMDFPL